MGVFVRRVKTASGATAVQIVHKRGRRVLSIEHVGSAHTDDELALLLRVAEERRHAGQLALDLEDTGGTGTGASAVVEDSSSLILWETLVGLYAVLGLERLADDAFRALVLARVIGPTSKADTVRVLTELGIGSPHRVTFMRCLMRVVERDYRAVVAQACHRHATRGGSLAVVLYDVTVRHEALVVRVEVRDHQRGRGRSRGRVAGSSPTGETTGRVGAAPTKPCRVSTAGWRERGERAEEVYARNRRHHLS